MCCLYENPHLENIIDIFGSQNMFFVENVFSNRSNMKYDSSELRIKTNLSKGHQIKNDNLI